MLHVLKSYHALWYFISVYEKKNSELERLIKDIKKATIDPGPPFCRKCYVRKIDVVFCPCGHAHYCEQCVENSATCPSCGLMAKEKYRVFLP